MASSEQQNELLDTNNGNWIWTKIKGKNGRLVKSKRNGNSLFLPTAGYRCKDYLEHADSNDCYWKHSLDTSGNACCLYFCSNKNAGPATADATVYPSAPSACLTQNSPCLQRTKPDSQ